MNSNSESITSQHFLATRFCLKGCQYRSSSMNGIVSQNEGENWNIWKILIKPVGAKGEDSGTLGSSVAECRGLILRTALSRCFPWDSMLLVMNATPVLLRLLPAAMGDNLDGLKFLPLVGKLTWPLGTNNEDSCVVCVPFEDHKKMPSICS